MAAGRQRANQVSRQRVSQMNTNTARSRELKRIEIKYGKVTPDLLIKESQRPNAVCHKDFTWDDAAAGIKCRRQEAREIIHSVEIEYRLEDRVVRTVKYVRDPECPPGEQGYVSVQSLHGHKEQARAALAAEFEKVEAQLNRARDLAVALGLERDITLYIGGLAGLRDKLRAA